MKRIVLAVAVVLCSLPAALADIPNPDSKKSSRSLDTSLLIRIDSEAKEARLIIPRSQVKQLRAELETFDGGAGDSTAAAAAQFTRMQTLVSGVLLSLAFVFGGLWFVRFSPKNSKAIVAAAIVLTSGSIATLVYGNAGPPPAAREINGKMFTRDVHMYKQGSGKIKLEVSDDVRYPELIVPDTPRAAGE